MEDLIKYQDWFRQAEDKFDQHLDSTYIASNVYRQPAGVGAISAWLAKFEEENGFKHVTCHGLRHTYCSLLLTQNVPIQTVSRYMGHSDSTITLEVYSQFIPDTQERVLTALDKATVSHYMNSAQVTRYFHGNTWFINYDELEKVILRHLKAVKKRKKRKYN